MRKARYALLWCVLVTSGVVATIARGEDAPQKVKADWPECGTGPLPQIKDLDWMAGKWDVNVKWFAPGQPDKSFSMPTTSLIEPMLNGTFLRETIAVPFGQMTTNMVGVRS